MPNILIKLMLGKVCEFFTIVEIYLPCTSVGISVILKNYFFMDWEVSV